MTADPFFGPHAIVRSAETQAGDNGAAQMSGPVADLCAMFRDPRYWRERDPEFRAKASEAFHEIVHGKQP